MNLSDLSDYIVSHAKTWFKAKVVLAVISVFLLVFAVGIFHPSVFFFKPDAELTYTEQINSLICMQEYGFCSVRYELVLGNTGKDDLDKVDISIKDIPESMSLWQKRVTPLTALNHKQSGAHVGEVKSGNEKVLEITDFKKGTVVEIVYTDIQLPLEEAKLLQEKKAFVTISTTAHVVNSDPRLTVVGRMIEANL